MEVKMSEFENRPAENPTPKKPRPSVKHVIAAALIGIFVILTLANLDSILHPFKTLGSILAPITIGLVLSYIANFILRFFEYKLFAKIKRRLLNRAISMLLTYIVLLAIVAGMVWLIIPSVVESVQDLRANGMFYVTRVIDSINSVVSKIPFMRPENGEDFLNLEKLLNYILRSSAPRAT
jgi:predicted PurR-regulated permease PerM